MKDLVLVGAALGGCAPDASTFYEKCCGAGNVQTDSAGFIGRNAQYLAWAQACIATFGSLYFSEVMLFPPCTLCWYQRILMYPLTIVLAVGILRRDQGLHQYVLPLSGLGFAIALYHNLLYFHIIPEGVQPCTVGIPCTTVQVEWLGFITIPLMSLTAFTVINMCVLARRTFTQGQGLDSDE